MIRLIDFIKAIHDAILAADEVLMRKNLELLDTFFEDAEDDPAIQTVLDDALAATRGVLEQDGRPGKEGLRNAQRAIEELAKALPQDRRAEGYSSGQEILTKSKRAKMVTIQYPEQTSDGVVMSNVHVPLITLAPLSMTQVSEVKLRSRMKLEVQDGEVVISFPIASDRNSSVPQTDNPSPSPIANLEITLTPHPGSEGLKKIVESYERLLRAQMPN